MNAFNIQINARCLGVRNDESSLCDNLAAARFCRGEACLARVENIDYQPIRCQRLGRGDACRSHKMRDAISDFFCV